LIAIGSVRAPNDHGISTPWLLAYSISAEWDDCLKLRTPAGEDFRGSDGEDCCSVGLAEPPGAGVFIAADEVPAPGCPS